MGLLLYNRDLARACESSNFRSGQFVEWSGVGHSAFVVCACRERLVFVSQLKDRWLPDLALIAICTCMLWDLDCKDEDES